jgi:ABC-type phosphate/phosphonate transport system substrate-binding protein
MDVHRAVSVEPWVVQAMVNRGQAFAASTRKGQSKTTYLRVIAYSKDPHIKNAERAKQLATLALSADSSAAGLDVIQVTLAYGYDIGIASSWRSQNHAHSPAGWRAQ